MNILYKLIFLLIFLLLQSCVIENNKISEIKEVNQEQEMITAYNDGVKALKKNDPYFAAKKFLESELLYPQSDWAPKSALMAAYSYYLQDYYAEAIFNLERYIQTYPLDKRMPYAHFLLAMCHYESIVDEKKDLEPLIIAKDKFNFVIKSYPNTDFALDSKFKIDLINDIMASKEMYIGRHYIKKEKWIPAINRFKNVLNDYETTVYTEEAIHRLVEIHYLSSDWYKKSYKLFNKNYKTKVIKKDKQKKQGIVSKFKKLLDL